MAAFKNNKIKISMKINYSDKSVAVTGGFGLIASGGTVAQWSVLHGDAFSGGRAAYDS
jgi:hypothetical protein